MQAGRPVTPVDKRVGKNIISFSGGVSLGFRSFMGGPFIYAEYGRNVKGKFWVGGRLSLYNDFQLTNKPGTDDRGNSGHVERYFMTGLYGIGYWEFPIARWLSFRAGGGLGLGLHYDPCENRPGIAPYMMVRAQWVVHITKNFGMTFSPLIAGPLATSQLEWSLAPVSGCGGYDVRLDILFHLGLYVRF